jgi:hypothetical protein
MLIENDWGQEVGDLVFGYDLNILIASMFITHLTGLLYYHQPYHCPTCIVHLGHDCIVDYTNANNGTRPECHNIWVQHMEDGIDNIFQG